MPRKAKPSGSAKQQKNSQQLAKQARADYRQHQREYNADRRALEKHLRAEARARDKELTRILKKARDVGLYAPKALELTPYRRRKARHLRQEYKEYLTTDKHFFLPANKERRAQILAKASALNIGTSRTGIFVPKEYYKRARLKEDKKRGEFFVERSGKTKTGANTGRIYHDAIPLASVSEIDSERDRIRRLAKRLCPLRDGEVLAFKVSEYGSEGYSRMVFIGDTCEAAIENLIKYLDKYKKSEAARINFYRHITVEKWSSFKQYYKEHPTRDVGKKARRIVGKHNTRSSKG